MYLTLRLTAAAGAEIAHKPQERDKYLCLVHSKETEAYSNHLDGKSQGQDSILRNQSPPNNQLCSRSEVRGLEVEYSRREEVQEGPAGDPCMLWIPGS